MEPSSQESLSPETANPWPLFPEQTIREGAAAERAAVSVEEKTGFWRRAAAFIIDLMLLQWITILFLWIGAAAENIALAQTLNLGGDLSESLLELAEMHTRVWSFLFLIYFSFFTSYGGQTPGKMALSIRVVTTDGLSVPPLRAIGRTFAYYLSFFTLGLGFIMAAIPPAKRALHDYVAGTVVVKVQPK